MNQNQLSTIIHSRHVVAALKLQKRKKLENHSKDVTMKELFELFNQFYKKFIKSTSCHRSKARFNEAKSITKRERFRCLCRDFRDRSRRIHFDLTKKSFSQSIEKKNKKKVQRDDKHVSNARNIRRINAMHRKFATLKK